MDKVRQFVISGVEVSVAYVETQEVKEGVECDIYTINADTSRDLAVVTVRQGFKTPLQQVLKGTKTIEGFVSGDGVLSVTDTDKNIKKYSFNDTEASTGTEVIVSIGQLMQWYASGKTDLVFYEVCEPPYTDGRFENLTNN